MPTVTGGGRENRVRGPGVACHPPAVDDLLTERLVLHPLSPAEAGRVSSGAAVRQAHWAPEYPGPGDAAGARLYLENRAASGDPSPFGTYEIRRRADGLAVGSLGFHGAPDETAAVSIGYGLVPSARGNGYAAEALRALLAMARARGVAVVRGDADLDNTASHRVMTAVGMRHVSTDDGQLHFESVWPTP